jgi:hypothetical protein
MLGSAACLPLDAAVLLAAGVVTAAVAVVVAGGRGVGLGPWLELAVKIGSLCRELVVANHCSLPGRDASARRELAAP